ncbi:Thiol:disulfide interchange protein CycY precursor [Roseovarius sp. THAF27]|uniref:DsbE family thiol:disulfide interchange protein n=1 Tax=Roseovarius sp. THAF27 TaxID=2587850 RepID=UPI0012A7E328|nr:DsbE family thiol:disulfide interchange protein [Roseovarius sp. THAF27]QFT80531.1 Thiol:disulfide interchange protein CycY precursor [Roseovarius sp. THAF27]
MSKTSFLMVLPPVIFAALAAVFYIGMQREDPDALPSTFIGKEAPVLPDATLEGREPFLPKHMREGEITVVNFWASWCPPCRAEHPTLHALREEGINLYGVNFKDTSDKANTYLDNEGNPFLGVAYDPKGRTAIEWGVVAPPETFIIDGSGTILFKYTGPLIGSDYEQRFRPALENALAAK